MVVGLVIGHTIHKIEKINVTYRINALRKILVNSLLFLLYSSLTLRAMMRPGLL